MFPEQLTVSDAARNPDDPQSDSATTLPFTLDNTAPTLGTLRAEKTATVKSVEAHAGDSLAVDQVILELE